MTSFPLLVSHLMAFPNLDLSPFNLTLAFFVWSGTPADILARHWHLTTCSKYQVSGNQCRPLLLWWGLFLIINLWSLLKELLTQNRASVVLGLVMFGGKIQRKHLQYKADKYQELNSLKLTVSATKKLKVLVWKGKSHSSSTADVKNKQNIWKPQVCPPLCCCFSILASLRVPPSNRFDFMNHCLLLKGTHCAFLEPRLSLLIYRENSFQYLSAWIFFFLSFFFLCGEKNNVEITKRVWGMRARLRRGGGKLGGDHQKGKLCTAGRKIIVLPQVKNIVAFLKSACKASYIIRMFKY